MTRVIKIYLKTPRAGAMSQVRFSVVSFAAARTMLLRTLAAASNGRTFLSQNTANHSAELIERKKK